MNKIECMKCNIKMKNYLYPLLKYGETRSLIIGNDGSCLDDKLVCNDCIKTKKHPCTICKTEVIISELYSVKTSSTFDVNKNIYTYERKTMCFSCICKWSLNNNNVHHSWDRSHIEPCDEYRKYCYKEVYKQLEDSKTREHQLFELIKNDKKTIQELTNEINFSKTLLANEQLQKSVQRVDHKTKSDSLQKINDSIKLQLANSIKQLNCKIDNLTKMNQENEKTIDLLNKEVDSLKRQLVDKKVIFGSMPVQNKLYNKTLQQYMILKKLDKVPAEWVPACRDILSIIDKQYIEVIQTIKDKIAKIEPVYNNIIVLGPINNVIENAMNELKIELDEYKMILDLDKEFNVPIIIQ